MRQPSHLIGFSSVLLLSLGLGKDAIAGDMFFILTSDYYQDAVAIGDVKSRKDSELVFLPTRVLIGNKHLPKEIVVQTNRSELTEKLQAGDAAVLTLGEDQGIYTLNHQAFEVSDSNPADAKVLSGPLRGEERFKFERVINSCGRDRNFFFDGKTVFLKQVDRNSNEIGENLPIGFRDGDQWVATDANPPICQPIQLSLWDRLLRFWVSLFSL